MYRIVLLTSLLLLFFSFTTKQAAKAPIVEWVGRRAYDFGSVLSGATVSVGFEFINVSKDSILLQTARTTCGRTAARWHEMSSGNGVNVYHRINRPNKRGDACAFEKNIPLQAINYTTLPNFPNYRLGPLDGSACDTLGINNDPVAWWRYETIPDDLLHREFLDLSYHESATWFWDFGDGTTSQDNSPVNAHLFTVLILVPTTFGI